MRSLQVLLAVALAASLVTAPAVGGQAAAPANACVGTMHEQPSTSTVVSVQGAHVTEDGYEKRPALLFSVAPNGSLEWIRNASANGRWWAYDVDPLSNGNYLFATTEPGISIVGEYDPEADEYVWTERFDGEPDSRTDPLAGDVHDADLISDDELLVADKGDGHERVFVYNRTQGRITWEWRFNDSEAFPESGGGTRPDWTHVNDVERVDVGESEAVDASGEWFMISVRNFDSVAFVNRTTGELERRLGDDGDHDVLRRQHNPDHMWGPNGELTVLVADSRNDRVVEYEYDHGAGEWERVWAVTGLEEPRDADRLPNGNTLIADRMGHRTLEVTPEGEVVWEFYTPYEPYDAERGLPPESDGPTMREQGVEGSVEMNGSAGFDADEIRGCADALYTAGSSGFGAVAPDVDGDSIGSEEGDDGPRPAVLALAALVALLVAGGGVYVWRR